MTEIYLEEIQYGVLLPHRESMKLYDLIRKANVDIFRTSRM